VNRDGYGRRRLVALLAMAILASGSLSACGEDAASTGDNTSADAPSPRELGQQLTTISPGELTIGARTSSPPFAIGYPPDNAGFDIDLTGAIAGELGLEPVYVEASFADVFDEAADEFDLIAPAAAVNPERAAAVAFSDPYYEAQLVLVVPKGSEITSIDDLSAASVAVQDDTAGATYAEGTAAAAVRGFPGADDAMAAVATGSADGAILDQAVAVDQIERQSELEIVEEIPSGDLFELAIPASDPAMQEALNAALAELAENGKLGDLTREYFDADPSEAVLERLGQQPDG
jgi:ABC-type amino acid transport substrate-binding protein